MTWNQGNTDAPYNYNEIGFIYWNNILKTWYAYPITSFLYYTSVDGKFLNIISQNPIGIVNSISYNGRYWLAVGSTIIIGETISIIKKSTDFINWTDIPEQNATTLLTTMNTVVWTSNYWLIGGNNGQIYSQDNGISWQVSTTIDKTIKAIGIQPTYNNNLYIVTNEKLENINYLLFNETQITYALDSCTLVQPSFLPFIIYKKISLGNYYIFIREQTFNFLDNFNFNLNGLNKFHVVSKFAKFEIEKKYNNETISPSAILSTSIITNISSNVVYEQAKFVSDLYRRFFEYVEFYIGDQLVEQLNKDTMEIQYQFLKDPNKRKQIDKLVKPYEHNGNMRFLIPLEFWFNGDSTQYLPLICLNYTLVSLKFKISNLKSLLTNTNYVFDGNIPEINIQTSIDGILLDTIERELFGNTQHE
jgi:hypothetical protein